MNTKAPIRTTEEKFQSAEYQEKIKQDYKLLEILQYIKQKPFSIAEISRGLKINRSTMRYYLSLLKERQLITVERLQNTPGRPTMVILNKAKLDKDHQERLRQAQEYRKYMLASPLTRTILKLIKSDNVNEKSIYSEDFFKRIKEQHPEIDSVVEIIAVLNWLKLYGYLESYYKITLEGEEYLKANRGGK